MGPLGISSSLFAKRHWSFSYLEELIKTLGKIFSSQPYFLHRDEPGIDIQDGSCHGLLCISLCLLEIIASMTMYRLAR